MFLHPARVIHIQNHRKIQQFLSKLEYEFINILFVGNQADIKLLI